MKKFLQKTSILMSFLLVNFSIFAQEAKECNVEVEDQNPPEESQAYEHISEYFNLEPIAMPDVTEIETPELELGVQSNSNPVYPGDDSRSPNSTTEYYNLTTLSGYTYNSQGLTFSPYTYGYYGSYSQNWQPTTITLPQPATSVTVNAYGYASHRWWHSWWSGGHYHYNTYYGYRLNAYNASGNYIGYAITYSYGYVNLTFNAPAGEEIAYIVVQTRTTGNNGNYTYLKHMWATYPQTNQPPVAIAQDVTTNTVANCQADVTASQIDNGSYDPDGDALTYSVSPAGPYPLGTTPVTLTVSDGELSSSATATITINDVIIPVADLTTLPDITGECDATIASAPTATDNCAGALTGTTSDPLYYDQQGTYTVTWTFDDGNGNTTTQTQNVVVDDLTAPVTDLPTLADITGECDATIASAPTATDNCAGALTGTTSDPLYYDQQGTYTVTWTFDDGNGNTTTQTQNVVVDDLTAPVTDIPALADVTGECDATVTSVPTATDNCAGALTGTTSDPLYYDQQGTYTVTWTFDDGNGNTTTQTQNVVVDDVTAPVADIPALANVTGECDATVTSVPTATDNCAGALTGTTSDPLYYDQQGTYTVTWTFDDGNGNTSSQTQNVVVDDLTAPVADIPALADVTGECDATVTSVPTATDNCSGALTGTTSDPLYYDQQGTYTVTWTFDDGNGNTTIQTQNVVVDDVTAPVADIPALADVTGECDATVTSVPTATDNCAGALTGTTSDPLYYDQQGTYTVTWTFDDGNGNTTTQTQTVIVDDVTAPVITAVANPITLWPPNHKYHTVNVSECFTAVSDNCISPSNSDVIIVKVTSDEAEDANGGGDGNTTDDMVIASDCKSVDLRKERQGNGNGRVYTIHMELDDGNGNIGTATYQVHVPKSKKGTAVDDGAVYEVTGNCSGAKNTIAFEDEIIAEATMKSYPNPTSTNATVEFTLSETNQTTVAVYNAMGLKVATLFDGMAESGQVNRIEFDGSNLAKGLYYIRLQSGNSINEINKLILTR